MRVKVLIFGADGKRLLMPYEAPDLPSAKTTLQADLEKQGLQVRDVAFNVRMNGLVVQADTIPPQA